MIEVCVSMIVLCVFFFKQKTAYEMRISDWSSDVCSSDLERSGPRVGAPLAGVGGHPRPEDAAGGAHRLGEHLVPQQLQYRHLGSVLAVGRIDEAVDRKSVV